MATLEQVQPAPVTTPRHSPSASPEDRIPRSPIPVQIEQPSGDVPISDASEEINDVAVDETEETTRNDEEVEGATETWQEINERAERAADAREDEGQPSVQERERMKIQANGPMSDLAIRISTVLMEPKQMVVHRAVECLGHETAQNLLDATISILAAGGQVVNEGSRKRTPGGIFFRLVIAAVSEADKKWIWAEDKKMKQAALRARQTKINFFMAFFNFKQFFI